MMMQAPLMPTGPAMKVDTRRNNKYTPGQLITSVELDQNALECFYCCRTFPCCCMKTPLAQATYMDIYSNGVEIGQPVFCCFCASTQTSVGTRHHYDDIVVFNDPAVRGEVCAPFPFCFVNSCDCFGEVLVMRGKCCSGGRFFGLGNQNTTCSYCPIVACCCPVSVMYGLAPGEANRAAGIINQSVSSFRNGQWLPEPRVSAAMATGGQAYQQTVVQVHHAVPIVMGQEGQYTPADDMKAL